MILIGLGANLPSIVGPPAHTIRAALSRLREKGIAIVALSRLYESEPVPRSDQPMFVNAVARIDTDMSPDDLLAVLHRVEDSFGRVRRVRNEARTLDIDLLDYDGLRRDGAGGGPLLPHPRLDRRAFVLMPLLDVAPEWRHPVSSRTGDELLAALPAEERTGVRPIESETPTEPSR